MATAPRSAGDQRETFVPAYVSLLGDGRLAERVEAARRILEAFRRSGLRRIERRRHGGEA